MASPKKGAVRGGLKTIDIQGKPYVQVVDRVLHVTDEDTAKNKYEMVSSEQFELGACYFVRVHIKVGDKLYHGTSQVRFGGNGMVDKISPFENAETSAVGRALGFAGIGIVEDIASADELQGAQKEAEAAAKLLSAAQEAKIYQYLRKLAISADAYEKRLGKAVGAMTALEAAEAISLLNARVERQLTEQAAEEAQVAA